MERMRTQEILRRYVPPPPAVLLDVGGGAGIYAFWLSQLGYEVHLVDGAPLHIEQARQASHTQSDHPLASIELGDARALTWPEQSVDILLLLGPLYHLTEQEERLQVLKEAFRVLKPGGWCIAAAISRESEEFNTSSSSAGASAGSEYREVIPSPRIAMVTLAPSVQCRAMVPPHPRTSSSG